MADTAEVKFQANADLIETVAMASGERWNSSCWSHYDPKEMTLVEAVWDALRHVIPGSRSDDGEPPRPDYVLISPGC